MHKIKQITLQNFKFFYGNVPINFDRKHVLIYGENGSGKSSIHWAIYTFLQSVFKHRITSYNVCYTKLLRKADAISAQAKKFLRDFKGITRNNEVKKACEAMMDLIDKGTYTPLPNEIRKLKKQLDKKTVV